MDTFFRLAVQRRYSSAVRYLLTLGISPIPADILATLHHSEGWKTASIIQLLVAHGADVHEQNEYGDSALYALLRAPAGNSFDLSMANDANQDDTLEAVKLLIGYGCDPLVANAHGKTPLHIAVEHGHISVVAKVLVGYGCDPLGTNAHGQTPLHVALQHDLTSVAKYLLTLGAHPPLDLLATLKDALHAITAPTLRLLVENGANALAHASGGESVLHIVLQSLCGVHALEAVEVLVGYGCDPLESNAHGKTLLHIAVELGNFLVAQYLFALGAHPPDLLVALNGAPRIFRNTAFMIRLLVENGANALAQTSDRDSVLHIVLQSLRDDTEALEAVKILVGYGCDPSEANAHGKTPLHIAVEHGLTSNTAPMICLLVENGANALAHNRDGDSALHVVLQSIFDEALALEALKVLVGYGCDPAEANVNGETPLYIALEHGYISVA
ncbi:ankyrin repeat-containing domain protein, partial [Boletus edulis BED1]